MVPSERNAFIIINPMIAANRSAEVTLSKFLRVIKPSFDKVTVIGGNLSVETDLGDVELVSFDIVRAENKIWRAFDIIGIQNKMCAAVRKLVRKEDSVFFWIADKMILPYLAVKHRGAEINYFIMGNVAKEDGMSKFAQISSKLIRYMAAHADYICMESKSVICEWPGLSADKKRVIHLYTDNIEMNPIRKRENKIGMVCRIADGKHVLESIQAMSKVHDEFSDWELEIIGSGRQQEECERLINKLDASGYIRLFGWVEHCEVVEKSKKWKYLLFPTDTEGLPNGLLEMMGRGIPALASPVGGIRDIVRDGENGFILTDTSAEVIKDGMLRIIALEDEPYLKCSEKAFAEIDKEYSLDGAIKNARSVIGV